MDISCFIGLDLSHLSQVAYFCLYQFSQNKLYFNSMQNFSKFACGDFIFSLTNQIITYNICNCKRKTCLSISEVFQVANSTHSAAFLLGDAGCAKMTALFLRASGRTLRVY